MSFYKDELCSYLDACFKYDLPINRFTYTVYRISNTHVLVETVKNIAVRINYNIKQFNNI